MKLILTTMVDKHFLRYAQRLAIFSWGVFLLVLCLRNAQGEIISMTEKNKPYQGAQIYKNGDIQYEQTESLGGLKFLYTNPVGKISRNLLSKSSLASSLYARYQTSSLSTRAIRPFIKKYNIGMGDYVKHVDEYTSFNDFFIRKLRPGARAIDQAPGAVVCPTDGKVLIFNNISQKISFFVKNEQFDCASFLNDHALAQQFEGGCLMIIRLAPYDYHRFHSPVDGFPNAPRVIQGGYESVNPLVYACGIQPLTKNLRTVVIMKTEFFGQVAVVPVGAMMVGSIVLRYELGNRMNRGDELGYFQFGGSTVAVLFQAGVINPDQEIVKRSQENIETVVRMGQIIARIS